MFSTGVEQYPPPFEASFLCLCSSFLLNNSNLQLALHLGLSQVVDGAARVPASVEQARFTDVQSQHALVVLHQEFRVFTDDHVVLHPDDLWPGKASDGAADGSGVTCNHRPVH